MASAGAGDSRCAIALRGDAGGHTPHPRTLSAPRSRFLWAGNFRRYRTVPQLSHPLGGLALLRRLHLSRNWAARCRCQWDDCGQHDRPGAKTFGLAEPARLLGISADCLLKNWLKNGQKQRSTPLLGAFAELAKTAIDCTAESVSSSSQELFVFTCHKAP